MKADALARSAGALAFAAAALACATRSHAQALDAPNVVPISPQLVTAGQPTAAALRNLRAAGFQAVITVQLRKAGIAFEPY